MPSTNDELSPATQGVIDRVRFALDMLPKAERDRAVREVVRLHEAESAEREASEG